MSETTNPGTETADRQSLSGESLVDEIVEQIVQAEGVEDFLYCLTQTLYDPHQKICTASSAAPAELLAALESLQKDCVKRQHSRLGGYLGYLSSLIENGQAVVVRWALAKLVGRALANDSFA